METTDCFSLPEPARTDWSEHNLRSRELWDAFRHGRHRRVPMRLNTNPRMIMLDPAYNPQGISYRQYFEDPATMLAGVLAWQYWQRHFLPGDHEKGLPDAWRPWFDIQNTYDAVYFGGTMAYRDGQIPDVAPFITRENKHRYLKRPIPDPMGGEWTQRCLDFYEDMDSLRGSGFEWRGRPLGEPLPPSFTGTDGIFTTAVALYGPNELCEDMLVDPAYVHALLEYLYEATRVRMRAWRQLFDIPVPCDNLWLADDAIQMLSTEHYEAFVLPWHKKLYEEFGAANRVMHLCGNAQRHFRILRETCDVTEFDTGFPVDFTAIRQELGKDTLIYGGPRVALFLQDDAAAMRDEVRRIATSGALEGGRFVFQEANNLPPAARLDMCEVFYEAVQALGQIAL